jgi:hypothetical protein
METCPAVKIRMGVKVEYAQRRCSGVTKRWRVADDGRWVPRTRYGIVAAE